MDPNKCLQEIRQILALSYDKQTDDKIDALIELMQGMDRWLSNGGFKPDAWSCEPDYTVLKCICIGDGPCQCQNR